MAFAHLLAFQTLAAVVPYFLIGATFVTGALSLFAAGAKGASVAALTLGLCAWIGAGLEAIRPARPASEEIGERGKIQRTDPVLTWRLNPCTERRHVETGPDGEPDFDAVYHIDADAMRHVTSRPNAGPAWLIFGGSCTFGLSLDDEDTLPSRLQALRPDRRVYNLGVNGFGTGDVFLYLPERVSEHPDAELCVYVMIDDHFRRAETDASVTVTPWGRNKPRFELRNGEPTYVGPAYATLGLLGKLDVDLRNRSILYRSLRGAWSMNEHAAALAEAMVVGMAAECEDRGTAFALVLLPYPDPTQPRVQDIAGWIERIEAAGIPVLDLRARFYEHVAAAGEEPSSYFFGNAHPRPEFHRLIADWMLEDLP